MLTLILARLPTLYSFRRCPYAGCARMAIRKGYPKLIVVVDQAERQYVDPLSDIFPLHAVLQYPVREQDIEALLQNDPGQLNP